MKTTVDLSGPLIERAKQRAKRDRVTLRELFQRGLVHELNRRDSLDDQPYELPDLAFGESTGRAFFYDDWQKAKEEVRAPREIDL